MAYVDGFVFSVPKSKRAQYKKMAQDGKRMFMKLGAIDYVESRFDTDKPANGMMTFTELVKPHKGEEVWFSYIVYKNKKARDTANKKMMDMMKKATPAEQKKYMTMPFDMKRMAYGGFVVEVEA